ncbi:RNA degradosome polyphosphate kinase [Brevibacterium sp. 91QC2O2]|uniref:RNA degradosome polyphosphate kinase n=1 Tax=Brevibacterium sp. 91QC2O2 TaxID=2968458 RepID=UPI00211CAA7D|nr:RNA degradosome polyphosphate kinase [Brevibacterium sp. 91QC2O2]MCQ9368918.1 RNA degradosome polyphosphate kinase [Brevibacterium sp. 91QC2O2]
MYNAQQAVTAFNLPEPKDRFFDRELSWLAFNERVLTLAADESIPLLERLNFLAIFASNLDEFFMVRVAGLKRRIQTGLAVPTLTGETPLTVMAKISRRARELMERQVELFRADIRPRLADEGIHFVTMDQLDGDERAMADDFFTSQVFPVLTPLAVDPSHPFPYISGLSLNLGVLLRNPTTGAELFARVKVPQTLPRFINVSAHRGVRQVGPDTPARFLKLEDLIAAHLTRLFTGMEILNCSVFRVTRNEDLEVEEDDTENLLKALEKELLRRRFGPAVRLEATGDLHPRVREILIDELELDEREVFTLDDPLDMRGLGIVVDIERDDLHFPRAVPKTNRDLAPVESSDQVDVFEAMREHEVLLHHPYDSFSTSVQAFLEQAATDPQVLAIKQTLYRTSGDSPIVNALVDAAQAGKQVLAVVEIKARFDEEANIIWARKLERAGVHVVYGVVGLKTHAKLSLVVRREADGLRRYCHVGTGNYNPKTARGYEDLGLLSTDPVLADDLSKLFNRLSGYSPLADFSRLLVSPQRVREGLLELIGQQTELAAAGRPARIRIKVNSIVDEALVDALYLASRAGVKVQLFVRGICSLRPGVPGLSENIEVRSVLGRYLEHSRIFVFGSGAESTAYIGSADLMHRNLDRRVEALVRLETPAHRGAVEDLFDLAFSNRTASFRLDADGAWTRHSRSESGAVLRDYQFTLIERGRRDHASSSSGARARHVTDSTIGQLTSAPTTAATTAQEEDELQSQPGAPVPTAAPGRPGPTARPTPLTMARGRR